MTNPYLEQENYLNDYKVTNNESKNEVQFDKLCFNVFMMSEDGKTLLQLFKDRFIYPPTTRQINDTYHFACIYQEGVRDAFRTLINACEYYEQRKKAEAEKSKETQ